MYIRLEEDSLQDNIESTEKTAQRSKNKTALLLRTRKIEADQHHSRQHLLVSGETKESSNTMTLDNRPSHDDLAAAEGYLISAQRW